MLDSSKCYWNAQVGQVGPRYVSSGERFGDTSSPKLNSSHCFHGQTLRFIQGCHSLTTQEICADEQATSAACCEARVDQGSDGKREPQGYQERELLGSCRKTLAGLSLTNLIPKGEKLHQTLRRSRMLLRLWVFACFIIYLLSLISSHNNVSLLAWLHATQFKEASWRPKSEAGICARWGDKRSCGMMATEMWCKELTLFVIAIGCWLPCHCF